jgi:phage recombination protein Bet
MSEAKVSNMKTTSNLPAKESEVQKLPALEVEMFKMEVQAEHVRKYFAPSDATTADIGFFIAMANSLGLNPWKRELHLVPFYSRDGGRKYAAVVGYEVYLNRAEASGKLDGWEYEFDDDRNPTKCTVTVHRKDWSHSFPHTVYMDEVMKRKKDGKPMALWATNGKFMLLKCTVTQAFRFCMPEACGALPYTPEEQDMINADERQYQEPPQLSEATVTSARVERDIDYLRGQYFKFGKVVWADEDARHKWNVDHGFPESCKGWPVDIFEKALDILDPDQNTYVPDPEPVEFIQKEEARLNDEIGAEGGTISTPKSDEDGAEGAPADAALPDSGAEEAMRLQAILSEKRKHIVSLVTDSPLKSIDTPGFITWRNQILPEEKGVAFSKLTLEDLNIIIGELETRENRDADESAETNGELKF